MHPIATKLNALRDELNATYLERSDAILAMLLAVLSGQHVFLLGPPGTAKSDLVRAMVRTFMGARYFETLLSKTRPTEAVMGPLDVKRFRETGDYVLKREHFASQVEFAFLDEIGKMSSILGHDLLALLNERLYHEVENGRSSHPAPLSTAFTASNEMVTAESDDAAALWDRLLFRVVVDYLQDTDNFRQLLVGDMKAPETEIEWMELKDVIDDVVPAVKIDERALQALASLKAAFTREHLYPSDRRWRASMRALQAHAFLDGRDEVLEDDLVVLRFTLWDTVEQIDKVSRLCLSAANPFVEPLLEIRDAIKQVDDGITERTGPDASGNDQTDARQAYGKEANRKLADARNRLDTMLMEADGRRIPQFKEVSDLHRRTLKRAFMVCLEQPEAEAEIMLQKRLGMGDGGQR
jgi:MoxR-like ATPase